MVRILQSTSAKMAVAAGTAVAVFAGGMAYAGGTATIKVNGGAQTQTKVATNEGGWGPAEDGVWEDVTGTPLTLTVPQGGRTITTFFSAESSCSATSWCSVRVVARRGAGQVVELHPRAGSEYAFDDDNTDEETWESNAMGRSMRLGSAGTWTVWVQGRVVGTGGMFLDDWYFQVDVLK